MPIISLRLSLVAIVTLAAPALAQTTLYPGLEGSELRTAIRAGFTPDQTLGYGPARDSLYTYEQRTQGALCGLYTAFCIQLDLSADASTDAFQKGINAEHTWPQSRGAENEPQRSDLHALFPARDNVNSSRGNRPYAEIPDTDTDAWYRLDQSQSNIPSVFLNEWSEKDNQHPSSIYDGRFEPREDVSGEVARAIAYFATIYEAQVEAYIERDFLTVMLSDLRSWNIQDPPEERERARGVWVAEKQGNENPFVIDPTLLERAFTDYDDSGTGEPADPEALWVNELHYDNDGTDTGEFVELAGRSGTSLTGWRLVLYNGNGGVPYDDRALTGTVDDEINGLGALAFNYDTNGVQNGPDAIALVDPLGAVVQFLSYEGPVVASSGPATGLSATEIGVEEGGSTPMGQSLSLTGTGRAYADFMWSGPQMATPGTLNLGQTVAMETNQETEPPKQEIELVIYPNPTRDHATVEVAALTSSHVRVTVLDLLGRVVLEGFDGSAHQGLSTSLNLSGFAPGLYTVRLESEGVREVRRLTVVH